MSDQIVTAKFLCPCCREDVGQQNLSAKLQRGTRLGVQVKVTRAYCERCDIAYQIRHVLAGAEWHLLGGCAILTGTIRANFLRNLGAGRGEVQMVA